MLSLAGTSLRRDRQVEDIGALLRKATPEEMKEVFNALLDSVYLNSGEAGPVIAVGLGLSSGRRHYCSASSLSLRCSSILASRFAQMLFARVLPALRRRLTS
jgi:hypothetical protein